MPGIFDRMHDRLFSHLGEQAVTTLRQSEPCVVNIEYSVTVNYEIGDDKFVQSEYATVVDVANIQTKYAPKVGDRLTVGAKVYVLDAKVADNGYMSRFILRKA